MSSHFMRVPHGAWALGGPFLFLGTALAVISTEYSVPLYTAWEILHSGRTLNTWVLTFLLFVDQNVDLLTECSVLRMTSVLDDVLE